MQTKTEFTCELRQVKTMADSTINVTLNLPEYALDAARALLGAIGAECRVSLVVEAREREIAE